MSVLVCPVLKLLVMAYKLFLLQWGLDAYVDAFEEEGIDDLSFHLLDRETIDKIFVKSGPRLLFNKHFNDYVKKKSEVELEAQPNSLMNNLDIENESDASTDSINSSQSDDYIFEPDDEELLNLIETTNFVAPQSPVKEYSESIAGPSIVKRRKVESVFPDGIANVLKKYTDGQIVLLNKKKLHNDCRQKLCKVIINELIAAYGSEIKANIFVRVAHEIEEYFVNEKADTYYIPYIPGGDKNKRGSGPKGKLWSRYINVRAALRLAKSQKVCEAPKDNKSPEKDPEESSYLDFLKVGTEPYTKVLDAWEQTCKIRQKTYLNSDLTKIYGDFPCLRINFGIELIERDFNQKYPDKKDIIYMSWPKVANAILQETKERKIRIVTDQSEITDNLTHALLALPFLFSPVTLKKSRKGVSWRPTRTEIQESFFLHILEFDELETRINKRKFKLDEYNITLQPFGVIVGNLQEPEAFYIVVNDIKYKLDTGIRTLELLFKLFHAMDIEYPTECEHVWLFLEEVVFNMKVTKKCPSTASVIADIKFYLD